MDEVKCHHPASYLPSLASHADSSMMIDPSASISSPHHRSFPWPRQARLLARLLSSPFFTTGALYILAKHHRPPSSPPSPASPSVLHLDCPPDLDDLKLLSGHLLDCPPDLNDLKLLSGHLDFPPSKIPGSSLTGLRRISHSAAVFHNASTRFCDGARFALGAEILSLRWSGVGIED